MKQRVISAIVAFMILIPIFIIGGLTFNISFSILTLLGLREFMKAKEQTKKYPDVVRLIAYIAVCFIYFQNVNGDLSFNFNYRVVAGVFILILLPVILYHDKKKYSVQDAFYLLGGVIFLGFSMSLIYVYREIDIKLIIFLFMITIVTDSYAYFVGKLIGKNKLLKCISPNKTWEGTIGGSIVGTFVCTVYYLTIINPTASIFEVSLIVLILSIVGQLGDLFFSAIKRSYNIKDFSNIMPGHGGILDRFDSIIFVMLTFTFFSSII